MTNGKKGVIGILTGGGDVPGLNPAIRAVTIRALREGCQVIGIRRGWGGLIDIVREKDYDNSGNYSDSERRDRGPRRTHRRHLPAHLPHQPGKGQESRSSRRIFRTSTTKSAMI